LGKKNDKYLAPPEIFFALPAVLGWLRPLSCDQKMLIFYFSSRKYNYFKGKYLLYTEVLTLLRGLTHSMLIVGVSWSSFSFRLN